MKSYQNIARKRRLPNALYDKNKPVELIESKQPQSSSDSLKETYKNAGKNIDQLTQD